MVLGKYTIFLVHIGVYVYYIYWSFSHLYQNIQLCDSKQNSIIEYVTKYNLLNQFGID